MASKKIPGLVKAAVVLLALGVLAVLFVRSADSSRAEPFTAPKSQLSSWTLELEADAGSGSVLTLKSDPQLASFVSRQVFARSGESQHTPGRPGIPLVLRGEYERALTGLTPDTLLAAARETGLESATLEPRCLVRRRVSEPGVTRGVYFILFDAPKFTEFRQRLAQLLRDAGGDASFYDPAAISPVLIVSSLDGAFDRWLPLRVESEAECLAPLELQ